MKDEVKMKKKSTAVAEETTIESADKTNKLNHWATAIAAYLPTQNKDDSLMVAGTAMIGGSIAFGSTLSFSTFVQKHILGISTGTWPRIIPSTVGFLTVCIASWVSHQAANETQRALTSTFYNSKQWSTHERIKARRRRTKDDQRIVIPLIGTDKRIVELPFTMHQIQVCCLGILAFKLMGGRFWSIAPSSFTAPGSFAQFKSGCIPAKSTSYATPSQKELLNQMGQKYGCHTCGTRNKSFWQRGFFVADHMPPNSVVISRAASNKRFLFASPNDQQFFFPQCRDCSGIQGGLLSGAIAGGNNKARQLSSIGGGKNSWFHGYRYRNSFVLPGGIVAAASTSYVASSTPQQ